MGDREAEIEASSRSDSMRSSERLSNGWSRVPRTACRPSAREVRATLSAVFLRNLAIPSTPTSIRPRNGRLLPNALKRTELVSVSPSRNSSSRSPVSVRGPQARDRPRGPLSPARRSRDPRRGSRSSTGSFRIRTSSGYGPPCCARRSPPRSPSAATGLRELYRSIGGARRSGGSRRIRPGPSSGFSAPSLPVSVRAAMTARRPSSRTCGRAGRDGARRFLALPLYPQYSLTTTKGALERSRPPCAEALPARPSSRWVRGPSIPSSSRLTPS